MQRGQDGVCGEVEGEAKYFLGGRNCHQVSTGEGGTKHGRFVILRFPLFYSMWVSQDTLMLGKNSTKSVMSRPFLCALIASENYDFRAASQIC